MDQRDRNVLARARLLAFGAAFTVLLGSGSAFAGPDDVVLLPTVVPIASSPTELPELRRPEQEDDSSLARWARQLDAIVTEAVQDLGLKLDVSGRTGPLNARTLSEDALVQRAENSWLLSPRLEFSGDRIRIRLMAVAPGSKVVLLRSQELSPREVAVQALVMTRDVVQAGRRAPEEPSPDRPPPSPAGAPQVIPARSQGRAVLAVNAAAFGGYVGFATQRASGSRDERLTYPLIALGTGIGLGGSMIVADEWDVGLGDAWYLSAGAWWPAASGFLLADGYGVEPADDRYVYGLLGAATGVTLATTSLTFKGMGEGGALLAHSGGAFGLVLGGMVQLGSEGRLDNTPTKGMGFGTGAGVLVAGAAATQIHVAPSRVLMIDLGIVLGGLTGAAAASPLVFGEEHTEGKDRAWLGAVAAGMIGGGVIAYIVTEPAKRDRSDATPEPVERVSGLSLRAAPYIGPIALTLPRCRGTPAPCDDARPRPIYGGGVQGSW